jgi:hypothetical protein
VVYKFEGPINTDFSGCKRIIGLQDYCKDLYNQTIALDFYDCQWFDANLSALLLSIIHKLGHEQKLNFSTDIDFLKQRFEVLFRIGLISDGNAYEDVQETTVPLQSFSVNDKKAYTQYINGPLLQHRGFPTIEEPMRAKIADDLLEIFCNAHHHADTSYPFFVSGQYYPQKKCLTFTLVDLGKGFLPRIAQATNGAIANDLDAIKWALEGNSSKVALDNTPGGLGIRPIYEYCRNNNGILQIATGNGYWSSDFKDTIFDGGRKMETPFCGSVIHLCFNK